MRRLSNQEPFQGGSANRSIGWLSWLSCVREPRAEAVSDDAFRLLFVGDNLPAVFYLAWELIALVHIPIAK